MVFAPPGESEKEIGAALNALLNVSSTIIIHCVRDPLAATGGDVVPVQEYHVSACLLNDSRRTVSRECLVVAFQAAQGKDATRQCRICKKHLDTSYFGLRTDRGKKIPKTTCRVCLREEPSRRPKAV